jgi:hypothetical protein
VDLARTSIGSEARLRVCRQVLRATSLRCGMIGYCQGMNYVAAFLSGLPLD